MRGLLCAVVVLWASASQAALVYLDAAFAQEQVAAGGVGVNNVRLIAANEAGTVWGGFQLSNLIREISNGTSDLVGLPSDFYLGALETMNDGSLLLGSYNSNPGVLYTYSGGVFTHFADFPSGNMGRAYFMAVSPVNGDVLVTGEYGDAVDRLIKFDSSGAFQWDAIWSDTLRPSVAYTPSGEAYATGVDGAIYHVDGSNGNVVQVATVPSAYAGVGFYNLWDSAFSSDSNLYWSSIGNDEIYLGRTNIDTDTTDLLAHWSADGPGITRYLSYTSAGLYINSFNPADLQNLSFGGNALSFLSSGDGSGVSLLTGNFNGQFAGFSFVDQTPEPACWPLLVLGLFLTRKRNAVRSRSIRSCG